MSYKQYCETRFSRLIGKPAIFDEENEEYALLRCREIWDRKYPSESFEINEVNYYSDSKNNNIVVASNDDDDLFKQVTRHKFLYSKFSEAYRSEIVYLIAARQRYKAFLHMLQKFADGSSSHLVPTSDIMLMWLTHQVCS